MWRGARCASAAARARLRGVPGCEAGRCCARVSGALSPPAAQAQTAAPTFKAGRAQHHHLSAVKLVPTEATSPQLVAEAVLAQLIGSPHVIVVVATAWLMAVEKKHRCHLKQAGDWALWNTASQLVSSLKGSAPRPGRTCSGGPPRASGGAGARGGGQARLGLLCWDGARLGGPLWRTPPDSWCAAVVAARAFLCIAVHAAWPCPTHRQFTALQFRDFGQLRSQSGVALYGTRCGMGRREPLPARRSRRTA
jgi:hypothetical protein